MRLIHNWTSAPRWFSTQAMAIGAAIQVAWVSIPPDLQASVPTEWVSYGTAVLLVLGVFGRLVDQSK